jgi:Tol biopolymer transport system component
MHSTRLITAPARKALPCVAALVVLAVAATAGAAMPADPPPLKGPYLGQSPPGLTPTVFAPGIVSTQQNEVNSVFTPDGKEFYFSSFDPSRGYTIMFMREGNNGWTGPRVASFSGEYSEVDMCISHDGRFFYFISKRPLRPGGERSRGYQIWVMERQGDGWGEARHLGPTINFGSRQLYPSVTRDGTLYFNSGTKGYGKGDFFRSRPGHGEYSEPENLGESINTEYDETDVFVDPDERYVIFTSVDRADGRGSGDLYISFRMNGSWTHAENMGNSINTSSSEFCPVVSPDGNYLFFTSGRSGNDDVYWVSAEIIDTYTPRKEAYFGQEPPGLIPKLFAPGVVSTEADELNCVFTPDGTELYFTEKVAGRNTLMTMSLVGNVWSERTILGFSGKHSDVDPFVTADGNALYFSSKRPLVKNGPAKDSDLWYVERTGEGKWGDPIHTGTLNTPGKDDYYTSITSDGTLYFSQFDSRGNGDIYRSRRDVRGYSAPERIGDPISTEFNEHDPFVAPDESYLIFTSNRPGGFGRGDLYISFKEAGMPWTKPENMGKPINSSGYDFCPMMSPDGRYLFFTRFENGNGDIYWVDARVIKGQR